MNNTYILDGHTPVPCDDLMQWGAWMGNDAGRRVAHYEKGGVRVSTVFLGLDHSFSDGTPVLFETMIFGGKNDQYQERCSTWDEAEAMHRRAVAEVEKS